MAGSSSNARKPTIVGHDDRWLRLLYMVIFAIIGYTVFWVVLFLAAVQFVLTWIHGEPNQVLRDFAGKLDAYFQAVLDFIGYATDVVPFPLSPLETSLAGAAAAPASAKRTSRSGGGRAKGGAAAKAEPGTEDG